MKISTHNRRLSIFLISIYSLVVSCTPSIKGTLADTRDYFHTGDIGWSHQVVTYSSLLANIPCGILTSNGSFYYLMIEPKFMAPYTANMLKIKAISNNHFPHLLLPEKIWVLINNQWIVVHHVPKQKKRKK